MHSKVNCERLQVDFHKAMSTFLPENATFIVHLEKESKGLIEHKLSCLNFPIN